MSSIIYQVPTEVEIFISWQHGRRNSDFDLIQLQDKPYVLTGVCWKPEECILEVGLESLKTAIKLCRSAQQNKTRECNGAHYVLCQSKE
jgi:hypothetical protein